MTPWQQDGWQCQECTFSNMSTAMLCEMCEVPRFKSGVSENVAEATPLTHTLEEPVNTSTSPEEQKLTPSNTPSQAKEAGPELAPEVVAEPIAVESGTVGPSSPEVINGTGPKTSDRQQAEAPANYKPLAKQAGPKLFSAQPRSPKPFGAPVSNATTAPTPLKTVNSAAQKTFDSNAEKRSEKYPDRDPEKIPKLLSSVAVSESKMASKYDNGRSTFADSLSTVSDGAFLDTPGEVQEDLGDDDSMDDEVEDDGPVRAPWETDGALTEELLSQFADRVHMQWHQRQQEPDRDKRPSMDECRLCDWKELLRPYPWQKVEKEHIKMALELANLRTGNFRRMELVYAYEILRSLGGALVSPPADALSQVMTHLRQVRCGSAGQDIVGAVIRALTREMKKVHKIVHFSEELGFDLSDVRHGRVQLKQLAHYVTPHLQRISKEEGGAPLELLYSWVRNVNDGKVPPEDATKLHAQLQAFLIELGEQFVRSKQSLEKRVETERQEWKGVASAPLNFATSTRYSVLQALEPDTPVSKRKQCQDLTAEQGSQVLRLLRKAWHEHCKAIANPELPLPISIRKWFDTKVRALDPSMAEARNKDLALFFSRNCKWRTLHLQAGIGACMHRALQGLEAEQEVLQPLRGVAMRKVVVFGATSEGKPAAGQSPVVIKDIPLELEMAAITASMREVGIRLAGSYRWLDSGSPDTNVRYVEWLPPGRVEERAKPLESVLEGATHVRLVLSDDEDSIEISLTNSHEYKADAFAFKVVPSMPRDSGSPQGSFRRLLVQVCMDGQLDVPKAMLSGAGAGLRGFAESGEVLAQALALYLGPGRMLNTEELSQHLARTPRLLYFASMGLLNTVLGPRVREAIRAHWEKELQLTVSGKFPMTIEQREARIVLRDLLLARGQESGDLTCAVIPAAHLPEIHEMLKRTKHPYESLSIENCNFEARTREIEHKLSDSAITFIIFTVTGPMSAAQLGSLVQRARGCLRIIFVDYPSLQRSLTLTRMQDKVLLPDSLGAFRDLLRPTDYKVSSPVGAAVCGTSTMLLAEPAGLCSDSHDLPWDRNWTFLAQKLERDDGWREDTLAWHETDNTLLHIVTHDEELVANYYGTRNVRFFDADEAADSGMQAFSQLDGILDRAKPYSRNREAMDEERPDAAQVVILFNSHLVLQSKVEDIISRCFLKHFQLVMVVRQPPVALRRIRVVQPDQTSTFVHAQVIFVRASVDDLCAEVHIPGKDIRIRNLLRGLRLVFGPEKLTCQQARTIVASFSENLESPAWKDVLANLAGASASPTCIASAKDLIRGLLGIRTERQSLAYVVGQKVSLSQNDVAFSEFVKMPVCRLLDQVHRLEAWLRYLVPTKQKTKHMVAQFGPTTNCQSNELLELLASAGEERAGRSAIPPPAYMGSGPADSTVSKEEIYMQCALQGQDLDWEIFVEQWGARKPPGASDLAMMIEASQDVMKLVLCIAPNSLVHLTEALAGGEVNPALLKLREHFLDTTELLQRAASEANPSEEVADAFARGTEMLLDRLAAIQYMLLTLEPSKRMMNEDLDEGMQEPIGDLSVVELNRLFRHHIKLSPGSQGSSWVMKLLALDEPQELLVEQTEVRKFLLNKGGDLFAEELATAPVGAAFMTLFATPHLREKICKNPDCHIARIPLFAKLLAWLNDDNSQCEKQGGKTMCAAERLSAKAFSTLLTHSPNPAALRTLVKSVVWPGCVSDPVKRAHVCNALANEKGSERLVVPVLEALVECETSRPEIQGSDKFRQALSTTACAELHRALKMQDLSPYLALEDAPPLTLDTSAQLRGMYINYFRGKELSDEFIKHFQKLSGSSCKAVGVQLLPDKDAPRSLLWYCWSCDPSLVLSFAQFPKSDEERRLFLAILKATNFRARAIEQGNGLSAAARMIVQPHTLPLAVFNLFAPILSWIHQEPSVSIEEKILLIAQDGHIDFPPYCMRWHYRPLPLVLREKVLSELEGTITPPESDLKMATLWPRVTEGVSREILSRNITLLFSLSEPPPEGTTQSNLIKDQKFMLAACILSWFRALGIWKDDVLRCIHPESQSTFLLAWETLQHGQTENMQTKYTAGSLPVYIDVKWLDQDYVVRTQLFAISKPSAQFTAQWLNNICIHAQIDTPPFQAGDLVEVLGSKDRDVRPGRRYDGSLETVAYAWGNKIGIRMFTDGLVKRIQKGQQGILALDTMELLSHFSLLADFCRLLRHQRSRLETLLRKLFAGLADGLRKPGTNPKDLDDGTAAVYDVFFLLFGVNNENCGVEMLIMTIEYRANKLRASKGAFSEMEWLYKNCFKAENETRRNLSQMVNERLEVHQVSRHCPTNILITKVSGGSPRDLMDLGANDPAYLNPAHFKLTFDSEEELTPPAQVPSTSPGTRDTIVEKTGFVPAALQVQEVQRSCFFTRSRAVTAVTETLAKRDVLLQGPNGRATITASDILRIDTSSNFYLYACLRVAPGLQPLLHQESPDVPIFRFTSSESTAGQEQKKTTSGGLCRVFASNDGAWRYLDELGPHTTLMGDGFYLTKSDDGKTWIPIFATNRASSNESNIVWQMGDITVLDQKLCVWPLVHSHDLVSLDLNPSVRRVLELAVLLAYNLAEESTWEDIQKIARLMEMDTTSCLATALQKICRTSVDIEAKGQNADEATALWLVSYQVHEHNICICLQNILHEVAGRASVADLIDVVFEVCRKPNMNSLPFVEPGASEAAELGMYLARQLTMVWCKIDTAPRKQLHAVLAKGTSFREGRCARPPTSLGAEKKVVQHHRITLKSFEKRSLEILSKLQKVPSAAAWTYDEGFTDSEVDSEMGYAEIGLDEQVTDLLERDSDTDERNPGNVVPLSAALLESNVYVDTELDRSAGDGSRVFGQPIGFGRPARSKYVVMTLYDSDCPHYFVGLETRKLKISYSMEDGLPLGYLIHKDLIASLLSSAYHSDGGVDVMLALRDRLLNFIANILRSPISDDIKAWILRKVQTQGRNPQTPPSSNVNSFVIAYSLCSCCPTTTPESQFLRRILTESLTSSVSGITPSIGRLITRKEQYGVYIVKGGTLFELQNLFGKENIAVRDFEREVSQHAVSINWMYLDIVKLFSGFTCIVYIQGLRHIEDALLKWLAEYTRFHPWRFVFFENVDTAWNYSENRDRCNFNFAPENPALVIHTTADLLAPKVASVRPSHIQKYDYGINPDICRDPRTLLSFFQTAMPGEFMEELPHSRMLGDFRTDLRTLLEKPDPCVVLVVSPPGAGKTFFMDDLRAQLESAERAAIVQFDGSSDILVTHTIMELLDRAVGVHGERVLLILDEYHMLNEAHKGQLFAWIEGKAASLQVVLIANRIDFKDRERVKGCAVNVKLLETRLSLTVLEEKLGASGVAEEERRKVRMWFVTSRLVFGEEAISLRLVDPIVGALQRPYPQQRLKEILLAKLPTISLISADHFVAAFLARANGSTFAGGPFATLFEIALLDEEDDLCSYSEYVSRMPHNLHLAPPAVRLLGWSIYVLARKGFHDLNNGEDLLNQLPNINLMSLLEYEYVDQVGTPFQLREATSTGNLTKGRAFSWAGDYESLDDIIDATKRGHSIDWHDLHLKHWKKTTITESDKICRLLSICRDPGACLEALTPANIALLLRSSSPANSVQIAHQTIRNKTPDNSREAPYQQALWALILNDASVTGPLQLAEITDGITAAKVWPEDEPSTPWESGVRRVPNLVACMEWAQEHACDHRQINSALEASEREELLQRTLVLATVFGGRSQDQQGQLWSGAFAQLLVTPTEESEATWREGPVESEIFPPVALPVDCLRAWLRFREAFERDWPLEVRNLWSILRSRAPASVINMMWSRHRPLLCKPNTSYLSPDVLLGVIQHEGGDLEKDLQRTILTGGSSIPTEVTDEDLLRVLDTALRLVEKSDLLDGADPRIVELVSQEIARRDAE